MPGLNELLEQRKAARAAKYKPQIQAAQKRALLEQWFTADILELASWDNEGGFSLGDTTVRVVEGDAMHWQHANDPHTERALVSFHPWRNVERLLDYINRHEPAAPDAPATPTTPATPKDTEE